MSQWLQHPSCYQLILIKNTGIIFHPLFILTKRNYMVTPVPIHPTKLEVFPGQHPKRWFRNPSPAEVTPADFNRMFPGIDKISESTELLPKHLRGDTNPGNLSTILKIAKWISPEKIVEIGTFRGRTTLALSQNTLANKIITVDLPVGQKTCYPTYGTDEEYLRTSERPVLFDTSTTRIIQVFADCTNSKELSDVLVKQLDRSRIDFAYIDAAHTYEGVMVPFKTILPMMREGGIIAFDDYMKPAFAPLTEAISYLSRVEGYVFYSVAHPNPTGMGMTSTIIFVNVASCKNRDWQHEQFSV